MRRETGASERMSDSTTHMDAGTERLLEESLERRQQKLDRRERIGNRFFTGAFLAGAIALAVLADAQRELSPWLAALFVLAFVAATRVELWAGTGCFTPTQIVFVPMLLLLPTPYVPLLVAVALVLHKASEGLRGRIELGRSAFAITDAWFSLPPAVVLVALDAQVPSLELWPAYVAALGAQIATDGAITIAWLWICQRVPPRAVVADLRMVHVVDVMLSPVGLLAALAAADAPAAALLVLPLVYLMHLFGRERESRMRQSLELGRAYRGTALLLRDLLEEDDEYTGRHTEDVVGLSVAVAERMELDEDTRRAAELGALLHDIGKIAVPSEIINKPGPLDDDEWAIMKTHTVEGERMLKQVGGLLADVGVVVRASHERWDGGGYPDGIAGDQIPVAARIVSACDAYNAMTTDRSYRKSLGLVKAVEELHRCAGTQFDPAVVEALVAVVTENAGQAEPGWQLQVAGPAAGSPAPAPAPQLAPGA
jgi:HD-GYP domain-containing protein (c-di-GMP phosphodiesterase class II)